MSDQSLRVRLGNWDRNICQCDFDDTPFEHVKYWSWRAMNWFRLKGFIILESSRKEHHPIEEDGKVVCRLIKKSYHVVFDRKVSWKKNLHVINWIGLESGFQKVKDYAMMQAIKETSTIRQYPKTRVVFRYGSQDGIVKVFLDHRRFIRETLEKNANLPDYCPDVSCFLKHLDEKKSCESSCFWMMPQIEVRNPFSF